MKPSHQFRADAEVLQKFHDAYVDLINASRTSDAGGWGRAELGPPGPAATDSWLAKRSAVAFAAGAAGRVYHRYGGIYTLRNAAYITNGVDPVANWEMSLRQPDNFPPTMVEAAVKAAIAAARQEAIDAELRERGPTGAIAAFIRWPSDLRDAVGPGRTQRAAAGVVGIMGQLVVTTLGGALAVGLAAGAVGLWKLWF